MANQSDPREPVLERGLSLALYLLLAVIVVVSSHRFFAYIEHYPYWSIDDGMSIVSMSILQTGRYGDPAVPLEPFSGAQRFRGFFNYGPWFFVTGAAIAWLFGFSVKALRAIHLLTGLALIGLGRRLFGGLRGAIATTLLAIGVCFAINRVQWPMFRPDPFVTLFAALAVWASARAILTGRTGYWVVLGMAAGCGALTHLAGGTLLPASFVIVAFGTRHRPISPADDGRPAQAFVVSAAALVAGWAASALMFYASFGFRIGDHVRLLLSYRTIVQKTTDAALSSPGVVAVWAEHFRIATSNVGLTWLVVLACALVGASTMVLRAIVRRDARDRECLALVAPGLTIFVSYCAGLGFYPNFHTGYVILPQLVGIWIVASSAFLALGEMRRQAPAFGSALEVIAAVAVLAFGSTFAYGAARPGDDPRMALTRAWVAIPTYVNEVLAPIPQESVAWGNYSFGGAGPAGVQLTSLETAVRIMADVPPEHRAALTPDYLVWSHAQTQDAVIFPLSDAAKDPVRLMQTLLPSIEFRVRALTAAVPYGTTRVYARSVPDEGPIGLQTVSAWDAELQRWLHDPSPVPDVRWTPSGGALRVTKGPQAWTVPATDAVAADLPAGWYLFRVQGTDSESRQLLSVGAAATQAFPAGDLPPPLDVAARLSGEPTFLLWQHQGGVVAVDLFAADAAARIAGIETFRITGFRDYRADRERLSEQPLPPLMSWIPDAAGGVTAAIERDTFTVRGNTSASGYQLVSPRLSVPAGATAMVRLPLVVAAGRVCVGILDEGQQKWLVPPTDRAEIHRFSTGTNTAVFVVVANCGAGGEVASHFTLHPGGYAVATGRWYVDSLMKFWQRQAP